MFPKETRFLIVDDTMMMRKMVQKELRNLGYSAFYEANDGVSALKVLEKQHDKWQPIHVVFSDWAMPGMQGIDFLRAVRRNPQFKALPFLLVTARADAETYDLAMGEGATDYLLKPFDSKTLELKLVKIWQKVCPTPQK